MVEVLESKQQRQWLLPLVSGFAAWSCHVIQSP
jgi:hypothetical protein